MTSITRVEGKERIDTVRWPGGLVVALRAKSRGLWFK